MTGFDVKFRKEENWIQVSMHFDTPVKDKFDALKRLSDYCLVTIQLREIFKKEVKDNE